LYSASRDGNRNSSFNEQDSFNQLIDPNESKSSKNNTSYDSSLNDLDIDLTTLNAAFNKGSSINNLLGINTLITNNTFFLFLFNQSIDRF